MADYKYLYSTERDRERCKAGFALVRSKESSKIWLVDVGDHANEHRRLAHHPLPVLRSEKEGAPSAEWYGDAAIAQLRYILGETQQPIVPSNPFDGSDGGSPTTAPAGIVVPTGAAPLAPVPLPPISLPSSTSSSSSPSGSAQPTPPAPVYPPPAAQPAPPTPVYPPPAAQPTYIPPNAQPPAQPVSFAPPQVQPQPPPPGYAQPGYAPPPNAGYAQPPNAGYAPPSNAGYAPPPNAGYAPPPPNAYISHMRSLGGVVMPTVTAVPELPVIDVEVDARYVLYTMSDAPQAPDYVPASGLVVVQRIQQTRAQLRAHNLTGPTWLQFEKLNKPLPILATMEDNPTVWYGIAAVDQCQLLKFIGPLLDEN